MGVGGLALRKTIEPNCVKHFRIKYELQFSWCVCKHTSSTANEGLWLGLSSGEKSHQQGSVWLV